MPAAADKNEEINPEGITENETGRSLEGVGAEPEHSLILAVQHLLSQSGLAYSVGAVRDLPELTSEDFDPKAAVSALRHAGFEASFGEMDPGALTPSQCQAIGFMASGEAVVIQSVDESGQLTLRRFQESGRFREENLTRISFWHGRFTPQPKRKAKTTGSGGRCFRAAGFIPRFLWPPRSPTFWDCRPLFSSWSSMTALYPMRQ